MNPYRQARYWLLLALAAVLLPHLGRLPSWLSLVLALAAVWRLPAVEGRIPLPPQWLLALMLMGGIAGIRVSYRTWFGPEAGVGFLIFCLGMKLLESRSERDHYVLLVLSLFVLATSFLFEQGVFAALYSVLAVFVVLATAVATNASGEKPAASLRKSGIMLAQALPLMLILFVFFPRLPPLWSMKLTDATGRTGMSDSMSPGDLAGLSRSDALAFRVEFPEGRTPSKRILYWRGLTFSRFDGRTWRPSADYRMGSDGPVAWSGQPLPSWTNEAIRIQSRDTLPYRIILEPTDQTWLFSLAVSLSGSRYVGLTRDFNLVSGVPVYQRLTYDLEKYPVAALDPELPDWLRQENLMLPRDGNPAARKMAREWRNHFPEAGDYIAAVLGWFGKSAFHYTLEPPALGDHRIDDFLFRTKRGFCEHYASSFTFLMRAAGIPARVVVGYQGGEPSPTGDSWQVRQMDAHAWAEVWVEGRGWVQYDPTAFVAPARIDEGMSALAEQRETWGDSPMSAIRFNNYRLLGELRNLVDYVNYRWQRDVVGFDTENQKDFLLRLLGDNTLWRQVAVMFAALTTVVMFLAVWTIWRHRKVWHPADRAVVALSKRLARKGLQRREGEGVLDWMARLEQAQPHWQAETRAFATAYSGLRYQAEGGDEPERRRELARLLRAWPAVRPQKIQLVDKPLA